jgi:adenosylmethionine-8-amino-7-oxononanoate aminotransferase
MSSVQQEPQSVAAPSGAVAETRLWHCQADMPYVKRNEVVIARGEGAYIWDEDGNKYFDTPASLWYCNVGHGRREIADAVAAQMAKLEAYSSFQQYTTRPPLELAERLAGLAPIDNPKVFLVSGGGDAVETVTKLARRYWAVQGRPQKRTILTRTYAYHGLHGYGTQIGGFDAYRADVEAQAPDTAQPASARIPAMDSDALRAYLEAHPGEVAAFFCEPIMGAGGIVHPAPGYLEAVQAICREHDVLLVADEVVCGFGRTGAMFGSERLGMRPDMMVMAKGLTSGYLPLGAALISERVWEPFWADGGTTHFLHGLTYAAHTTASVAALANLDIIEGEGLVERVRSLESVLEAAVAPLAEHPVVTEVRAGIGLLAGVQVQDEAVAAKAVDGCLRRGIFMRQLHGATLQISPPFVVTESEIETLGGVLREALDEAAA